MVMEDSGMACRLRDRLVDLVPLVALVGLSIHWVLICLEGLAAQMTLACSLSWC